MQRQHPPEPGKQAIWPGQTSPAARRLLFSTLLLWGWLWLTGCAATVAVPPLPTIMPVAAMPGGNLAATAVSPLPTPTTPPTIPPTALPATAAVSPPIPTPTPNPTGTAVPANPNPTGCRPAAELAAVRPVWLIIPGPWPRATAVTGLLGHGPHTDPPLLHLGFDVEGDPAPIGPLLDQLDQRQIKTTFFMLGSWAETYPDWVQEIARRGHELASHGYSHQEMSQLTAAQVRAELLATENSVQGLTGQTTQPWFRPPFGGYTETSLQVAYEAGWTTVIWTGSSNDWRSNMDADKMCATLRYYAAPGAILYAHTNRMEIVTAVDRFIAEMQAAGYTFVPLSVLLSETPQHFLQSAP